MKRKSKLLLSCLIAVIVLTSILTLLYPFPSNGDSERGEGYLFTFAQITDSQFYGSSAIFENVTTWLAQQENLSFVVHTGDIVSDPLSETTWKNAYGYMHQLDIRCRWVVLAGDDDIFYENQVYLANYEKYFGKESIDQFFIVENKLLFILLSWNNEDGSISKERLRWMDGIIQEHENLYVVICLHPTLFNVPFLSGVTAPNADEIWNHIDRYKNVIMTLSGHIHQSWVYIHLNRENKVWALSTPALTGEGYIRLFDVYDDKIECHAYSLYNEKEYTGALDRFIIELIPSNNDVDGDLWRDDQDIMPTHPIVPSGQLTSLAVTIATIAYWTKERKRAPRST